MPGESKRQHIVPRFLLNHFTNENGRLHCFDKNHDRLYESSPTNVFVGKHIYTLQHDDRVDSYGMEKALAKLEWAASDVVKRIVDSARMRENPNLSPPEKAVLDEFVLVQWRRVSERRKELQADGGEELLEAAIEETEGAFPHKDVRLEVSSIGLDRIFRNSLILALAYEPPDWLSSKGLAVVLSPFDNASLIIGSNPVLLAGKDRRKPDGEVIMPVAMDVAISLALKAGQERLIIDDRGKLVRMINGHVFRQSDIVAAPSPKALRGLVAAFKKRQGKSQRR